MTRTTGAGFASSFADESGTVEQPTAELLAELGWQVVNLRGERPGAGNPTGRASFREIVLPARLRPALARLNPTLPQAALDDAVAELVRDRSAMLPVAANREVWSLLRDGVQIQLRGMDGATEPALVRVINWADKAGNDFLLAAQPTFQSALYTRRPDLVGFVNGLPLLLIECKAPGRPLADAHEDNLRDYRDTIPALFPFNGAVVLTNGIEARVGAAAAPFSAFAPWPRLAEDAPDSTAPEVLLRAVCAPSPLLDMVENFTVFEEERGGLLKKLSMPIEFSPKAPVENSPVCCGSVASVSPGRLDVGKGFEIEIDDGLQRLSGGRVAQPVGHGIGPGGVFGLERDQLGDRVAPSLRPGAPVCRPFVSDDGSGLLGLLTGAIAGLPFGAAERVPASWALASGHGSISVT